MHHARVKAGRVSGAGGLSEREERDMHDSDVCLPGGKVFRLWDDETAYTRTLHAFLPAEDQPDKPGPHWAVLKEGHECP